MKRPARPTNLRALRLVLGAAGIFLLLLLALTAARPGQTAPADLNTLLPQAGASQEFASSSTGDQKPADGDSAATYRGVLTVAHFDVSPPLRDIPPLVATPGPLREIPEPGSVPGKGGGQPGEDSVVQTVAGAPMIPTPFLSFDGPSNTSGVAPPDPDGEVGPNNYVTMINLSFQIFNKSGVSVYGPALNNTLWSGFGGPCQNENQGDPIVLYDQLADRWLMSQFTANGPMFYNCVALSTGSDPVGTYYRWAFSTGNNFPDYPKYGMWPDAYYISTREFLNGSGGPFQGVGAYAANRAQMLAGNPNPTVISFLVPPGGTPYYIGDGLLPADLDGTRLPPTGSPNYYVGSMDNGGPYGAPQDALTLWKFHADFSNPPASTFVRSNTLPIAAFDTMFPCSPTSRDCIAQPGTSQKLDHLGYRQRPLFRLAYRNMGSYETMVTNQSVEAATNVSGIRWWEIRSPASSPVIYQEGTYAPGVSDSIQRWMGSIAMDKNGNMALGYSASNGTTTYPSSWYTGRLVTDPLGTMPQGEAHIVNGTGSQTGTARWGDYSDMTVDPVDDCTFWYVNQYIPTSSSAGWRIRIGAFRFSGCAAATPTPAPTHTPTRTPTVMATPTPPPCGVSAPGSWTAIAPLNTARSRVGVVYFAPTDRFYALGGEAAAGRDIPIEEYNPTANTWTNRAHLLVGVSNTGASTVGNFVYVPGGYDGSTSRAEMQRFDPAANAVVTVSPMPGPAYGQAVVAFGTKIYVMGGSAAGTEGTTNYIYDTTTGTWSSGAPVPAAVEYAAAATDGVRIYLIGGRTQSTVDLNAVQRYDPGTNSWTSMANLNSARGGPAAFFDGFRIWAVNGGWGSHLSSTEVYAIGAPNWSPGPSTLAGERTLGAAFSASRSMAIKAGGYDTNYSAEAEKLTFTTVPCATATPTRTNTPTPTATSTACTLTFSDVPPASTFYPYIHCLACRSIISGYPDGSFKPNNNVTRGQFAKIASNSAGFNDPPGAQQFQDVAPGSTFFPYIWRLYDRGLINGYVCGGTAEPCVPPNNLPYFRPNANITRGQLTKIDSNAAGFSDTPTGRQFQDVAPGSAFYTYTYRLVTRNIMAGYACGGSGEPCVPPGNLPYFRPNNNASRGQASKIVANTFFPDCQTPVNKP